MSWVIAVAVLSLLFIAAWRDIATRIIPDYVTLILLGLGALLQIQNGVLALVGSAGTALLLFVLLMIAYSRQLMGGGDVKMMTAFAFGLTPIGTYWFVTSTVLAGGLLGIAYLLLSRYQHKPHADNRASPIARVLAVEAWRVRKRAPLPYGVAIAIGGAITLLHPVGP
jgi:prepilin peptidase CpaA